ncbi:MAG: hypothetical protein FJ382_13735 [Verrucomicrobia bacterium]|nr:hypothetical protein [Verrucomicrobiota bacterium]
MKPTLPLLTALLLAPLAALHAADATKPASKPNVIIVLTDDQGYGDLACHGNPHIKTPNLDKLHSRSVRLTDFHVSPLCTPTRAAIMTGCDPVRVGAWSTTFGRSLLREGVPTMADAFAASGYRTAMFGKWHLGDNYPFRPQDRGFQEVLCHGGGGVGQTPDYWGNDYFDDTYFRNGHPEKHTGYCTDVWFSEALKFIAANRERPFFVYLATNAPHAPYNVSDDYAAPYRQNPAVLNPSFYGMIANIDDNMGRLMDKLGALGLAENTVLIFLTDNGTAAGVETDKQEYVTRGHNGGMRGKKGSYFEGGHRVPCFMRWPAGGLSGGRDIGALAAHVDLLPTLIELCGLTRPVAAKFDGVSLVPLLRGEAKTTPDRSVLVRITKTKGEPGQRAGVVMSERWRLVRGTMLFDVHADPGQRKDIAAEHPDIVQRLSAAYDRHWAEVSPAYDDYCRIVLGHDAENPARLTAFDWHGMTPWHQPSIMQGLAENGFWAVHVARDGNYEFALRRWPEEVNQPITAALPGARFGVAIRATHARLKIADVDQTQPIPSDACEVVFRVKLKAGPTLLQTWLLDGPQAAERDRGAYYVRVERKAEKPTAQSKPKAEAFYTPKRDRAAMTSDVPIDKALPNVLILGDSISIGYTRQVREGLKGKANVIRPNANCGDTRHGLAQIETWLGDGNWQVIHFNWGLHDLCYRNPELKTPGQRDKVNGTLSVPLTEYETNLETLVERLKQTGAKLIFANTTLVPEGEAGRFPGDEVKYNAVAQRVMEKHGVPINDLHATTQAFPPAMFAGPGNVHFSAEGSAKLAGQVVVHVAKALPIPANAAPAKTALFIGDAVGAQYAETLRDILKARISVEFLAPPAGGKAEVDAFLAQLPALLAKHDLVLYAGVLEAARVDPGTGKPLLSTAQFRQFLDGLGKSGPDRQKKWIWATSVPVPDGTAAISAAQVEANNHTLTDNAYKRRAILLDLHEYVRIRREDMQRAGDFLLTDAGVSLIASVVANKIEEVLLEGNEPDLPNLLVLGDSIVGQYSTSLRSALLHKANVRTGATAFDHQPDWSDIVRQQVTEPEREMGRPFDLIQFNWGQHALKWMQGKEYSREPKEGYTRCIPLERYGEELEKLVMELRKTGRPLVWAATTPANNGSKPDDAEAYNAVALQVMHQHQIPVNDLYRFVRKSQLPMQGCHFPREASERIGNQVAGQLLGSVSKSNPSGSPSNRTAK